MTRKSRPRNRRRAISRTPGALLLLWTAASLPACQEAPEEAPALPTPESAASGVQDPFPRIPIQEACRDAGYLCQALSEEERIRVQRWPGELPHLAIRVPLPPLEDRSRAEELRQAAVRGFLAWDGLPFPLRIRARDAGNGEPADVQVVWVRSLDQGRLGQVETVWAYIGEHVTFQVEAFRIALEAPDSPGRLMTPDQVQRIAAHEMGHALGLGHSDSSRDLMYPSNTARSLSARDYRTLWALYALPNGSVIVGEAEP